MFESCNLSLNRSFRVCILPTMFTSSSKPRLRKMLTRTHCHIYRCLCHRISRSPAFVPKWFPFFSLIFIKLVDSMRPVSPFPRHLWQHVAPPEYGVFLHRLCWCIARHSVSLVVFPYFNHTNRRPSRSRRHWFFCGDSLARKYVGLCL